MHLTPRHTYIQIVGERAILNMVNCAKSITCNSRECCWNLWGIWNNETVPKVSDGENRCATMLGTETFLCVQESVTLMLSERKELTNQSVLLSFKPFLCLTFAHTPEACAILHTHNPQLSLTLTQSPFLQGHQAREVAKEFPRHEWH